VGQYGGKPEKLDENKFKAGIAALEGADEVTLLLFPDAAGLTDDQLSGVQNASLAHCKKMGNRFAILDVKRGLGDNIQTFRDKISSKDFELRYGAAYYPYLSTIYTKSWSLWDVKNFLGGFSSLGEEIEADLESILKIDPDTFLSPEDKVKIQAIELSVEEKADCLEIAGVDIKSFKDRVLTTKEKVDCLKSVSVLGVNWESFFLTVEDKVDCLKKANVDFPSDVDLTDNIVNEKVTSLSSTAVKSYNSAKNALLDEKVKSEDSINDIVYSLDQDKQKAYEDEKENHLKEKKKEIIEEIVKSLASNDKKKDNKYKAAIKNLREEKIKSEEEKLVAANKLSINSIIPFIPEYDDAVKKLTAQAAMIPPSGAIAGIYSATDQYQGVWKAPANVSIAFVSGVSDFITNQDQEKMNIDSKSGKSINAIRAFSGKGILVGGARTLDGNSNEWRYIPVRRLFNYIEESVQKSTSWAVFSPNDGNTWIKIKSQIENFLNNLWRAGALAGSTPEKAYFVNVGLGITMTDEDIKKGYLYVEIGLAAVRPAEFIVLRFSHKMQE